MTFEASLISGPICSASIELRWDEQFWEVPDSEVPNSEAPDCELCDQHPETPPATPPPLDHSPSSPIDCSSADTSFEFTGPLVVRMCVPSVASTDDDPAGNIERDLLNEAAIYESPAGQSLQAKVLPEWYGLFRSDLTNSRNTVWVSVLEDVGPAAGWQETSINSHIPSMWVSDTLRKFNALHAAGIAHGDLDARHIRVGNGPARHDPDGGLSRPQADDLGLRVIDLDQAKVSPEAVADERLLVRRWLGVDEWWAGGGVLGGMDCAEGHSMAWDIQV